MKLQVHHRFHIPSPSRRHLQSSGSNYLKHLWRKLTGQGFALLEGDTCREVLRPLPATTHKHPRIYAVEFEDTREYGRISSAVYEDQPLQLEHDPHGFQKSEIPPEPGQRGISPLKRIRNSMKRGTERSIPYHIADGACPVRLHEPLPGAPT